VPNRLFGELQFREEKIKKAKKGQIEVLQET